MVLGLLAHVTPSIFFPRILRSKALVYNSYFSKQPFYGNYSTLDSPINTVISHAFAYSSIWHRKPWQGLFTSHGSGKYIQYRYLIAGEKIKQNRKRTREKIICSFAIACSRCHEKMFDVRRIIFLTVQHNFVSLVVPRTLHHS